jgi:3-deoxy-D-manno-octulosonic-acid transferase
VSYRLALAVGARFARALAPLVPPWRAAVEGRAASAAAFAAWTRRPGDPAILLHAASAGELRQAEPLLRRLHGRHPEWQFAVTYTSRSAVAVARELPADIHGFLPWDTPGCAAALLDAVRPDLLAVSKLDLWPELAWQASRRGIPIVLLGAGVRPDSSRLRWPARWVLRPQYSGVAAAAAATAGDAERLTRLGVPADRIQVSGDPRADAVVERLEGRTLPARHPALLVAGSTWPEDEDRLLDAFGQVRARRPEARLLLAPHQPTPARLARLERRVRAAGLPRPLPPDASGSDLPVLIEDRVGRLAFLYGLGSLAYVGGGFRRAGLHSTLEPAAWGVPVLAGPRWCQSGEAVALAAAGGLIGIEGTGPRATDALARQWLRWLEDETARTRAGEAGRQAVLAEVGATDRCAALIESRVTARPPRPRS